VSTVPFGSDFVICGQPSHCRRDSLFFPGRTARATVRNLQRDRALCYSVAAGSLVCARTGNSNSILSSSFKTSRARKGLPFRDRKPESTSRVRRSSISCARSPV
jgi:hypothetical protein